MCRDGYPHLSKLKTLVIKSKCRINTWFMRHYAFRIVSTSCISFVLPQAAGLIHSAAPPLQTKPAALGFALGAAFGGLFGWKISAGAGPLVRLALPNQRSRSVFRRRAAFGRLRAGLGPAPTERPDRSHIL